MGLVRLSLFIICCSTALQGYSQTTISEIKVSVIWNRESGSVLVMEEMRFDNSDPSEQIKLQSLPVNNDAIGNLELFVKGESLSLKPLQDSNGLKEIEIVPGDNGIIHLEYSVKLQENMLIVPLIFPRMNNIPSNESLFSATVRIPKNYRIVNSFPTMEAETTAEGEQIAYSVSLPVIPSMLRVEISKNDRMSLSTIDILDGTVLVILALVGFLGWRKRKMLI